MRMLYSNLADAMALTASGELVGFPGTNVQHQFLIKRWRSLVAAGQWIKFDAGTGLSITADIAAIIQHNLSSAVSIHVQANDTDDWAAPPLDSAGVWDAGIILTSFGGSKTYRFWRFYLDDPSNAVGYLEIGRAFLGLAYRVEDLPDQAIVAYPMDPTVISFTPSGQSYADLGQVARVYEIPMGLIEEVTRQSLLAVYAAVGQHKPLIVIPDENNVSILPPLYAQMMKVTKYTNAGGWLWIDDGLKFQEVF